MGFPNRRTWRSRLRKQSLRSRRRQNLVSPEKLEAKLPLTTTPYFVDQIGSLVEHGWAVFVQNASGDDFYLRQITATGSFGFEPSWQWSNNASYENASQRAGAGTRFNDILITNGTAAFGSTDPNPSDPNNPVDDFGPPSLGLSPIIPGTLSGSLTIYNQNAAGGQFGIAATLGFVPQYLFDPMDGLAGDGVPLVLTLNGVEGLTQEVTITRPDGNGDVEEVDVTIEGRAFGGGVGFTVTDADGPTGVFYDISADYATPAAFTAPNSVQITAGQTITAGLTVYGLGPDSEIAINSPVLSAPSSGTSLDLAATNITLAAPTTTSSEMYLSGETISIEAPTAAANGYRIIVANEPTTSATSRGRLQLQQSARLEGTGGGQTPNLRVVATDSDVVFLGDVSAAIQSYQFTTDTYSGGVAGRFTTRNALDQASGTIAGGTVDILLTNSTSVNVNDVLTHVVSLDTAVDSLRLTAAEDPVFANRVAPYRYDVSIREEDDLSLDATLASGEQVSIVAGGDLAVNATVQTSGDLTMASSGRITGNAWLTTTEGSISVTSSEVSLDGLVQVLAPPVDETLIDVEIVATNGSISLGGGVSAVNRIRLDQRGSGSVSSNGLVAAEYLDVFSTGAVTLQTQSRFINVESGGQVAIEEADDAEFVMTAAGLTSLSALGIDPNDGSGRSALKAELRGATNIVVSAPSGSVDVTAMTSAVTTVGDAARLLTGSAASMQAAGDVSIRSTQGDIVLLDAPIAGDGLLQARVASASNGSGGSLSGTYAQNNPGVTPATLTGLGNRSLNSEPTFAAVFPGLGGSPLRVRDLVLLRGQSNANENGLYQISQLGSTTTPWRLTRVSGADTTAEFGTNTRVSITDGDFAGRSFRVGSYTNVLNTTPLRVTQGAGRSAGELTVRLATDATPLAATFVGGQLIASANGALSLQGLAPASGDFILVSHGVTGDPGASSAANGVYEVTDAGSSVTAWVLTRVANEATVVVSEGYYRTALTGLTFRVAYDGLGEVPVEIVESTAASAIGSYDPRDAATFVVSTAGGTNDDAGSLGKMLRLVQSNAATDLSGERVEQSVRFGNVLGGITGPTGTIVLRQELPVINTVFEIDSAVRHPLSGAAAQPIVVDGSRITSTRESTFVTGATEVNGFEFAAGASTVLTPTPEEASRSRLSGLRIAGFEAGGAVVVDGASNLLVENLTIGLNAAGTSQAVRYGVRVTGASGAAGPVTLLDNSIYSASVFNTGAGAPLLGAGVLIDGAAQGVQVVGGTIGGAQGSNTSGIVVESSNDDSARANLIGVNPLSTIKLATTSNRATLTIPQADWDTIGEDLHLGQSVAGNGIAAGSEIIHINPATRAVVLSNRMTSSIVGSTITFGAPGRTTVSDNFYGVELRSGHVRMANTTVEDNVLDGVVVGTALPAALWAQIGAGIALDAAGNPDPTIRTSASNAIHSNGRYGIRFASGIDSMTKSFAPANPPTLFTPTEILIRGNFIGTNTSGGAGLENGRSDYYWDNTSSSTNPPEGVPAIYNAEGNLIQAPTSFFKLISSGDPFGTNPAEDFGNGNVSADLAPATGGGGGGGEGGGGGKTPQPPQLDPL